MSFNKDRYGFTQIKDTKCDNLSIGWDYDDNENDVAQRYPVFLFTPTMSDTDNHHHIALSDEEVQTLHKWLGEFMQHKGIPVLVPDSLNPEERVNALMRKRLIK